MARKGREKERRRARVRDKIYPWKAYFLPPGPVSHSVDSWVNALMRRVLSYDPVTYSLIAPPTGDQACNT
jgi:hypothetical protein